MSIIPVTVPTGAIRYNTDSNKMECFNGTKWMQIAVSSPDLDGGARGLAIGGRTPTHKDEIDYVTIPTAGNAIDFGNLAAANDWPSALASNTRGVVLGGRDPSNTNVIQYITISSTGNTTNFGDLSGQIREAVGTSNQTRGLNTGGKQAPGSYWNNIEYITIASTGNAQDFGDINNILGTLSLIHI